MTPSDAPGQIATRVFKGSDGWTAKSTVPLDMVGGAVLRLRLHTYTAGVHKGLITRASVHHIEGGFETHRLYSDFSQMVAQDTCKRATEKVITAAHGAALARLPEIMELAKAHYAAKAQNAA